MGTKHTPGPWVALPDGADKPYIRIRGICLGERYEIANVLDPAYDREPPREAEETRANAHLIAAAPDLLGALLIMVDAITPLHNAHFPIEREGITDDDVDAAQQAMTLALAAIAKARGETC